MDKENEELNLNNENEKEISKVISQKIEEFSNFDLDEEEGFKVKIKIIGAGGAGGNAINDMITNGIEGVEFIAINTDLQDLRKSMAKKRLQIGKELTKGLGAGADPKVGEKAAEENRNEIKELIKDVDMLFITAGMGGGTGTGAAPVIAEIARELEILTIAVVSKPFSFEGTRRQENCEAGIEKLKKYVDTIVVIPNDKLFELEGRRVTLKNAFKEANKVLFTGVKGIAELVTIPGLINIDFADVKTIVRESGIAMLGFGEGFGESGAVDAAKSAISNPLLEKSVSGSRRILINISGTDNLTMESINIAVNFIKDKVSGIETNFIFGSTFIETDDPNDDIIKITLIATDFENDNKIKENILNKKPVLNTSFNDTNKGKKDLNDSDFDSELDLPAFIRRRR
ncbi:MAG: cell division protein FtsZ [Fusobacteria bacterium]|nr:cell division protein FtsZ [Fusobacteriota bacterium]